MSFPRSISPVHSSRYRLNEQALVHRSRRRACSAERTAAVAKPFLLDQREPLRNITAERVNHRVPHHNQVYAAVGALKEQQQESDRRCECLDEQLNNSAMCANSMGATENNLQDLGNCLAQFIASSDWEVARSSKKEWTDLRERKRFPSASSQALLTNADLQRAIQERVVQVSSDAWLLKEHEEAQEGLGSDIVILLLSENDKSVELGLNRLNHLINNEQVSESLCEGVMSLSDLIQERIRLDRWRNPERHSILESAFQQITNVMRENAPRPGLARDRIAQGVAQNNYDLGVDIALLLSRQNEDSSLGLKALREYRVTQELKEGVMSLAQTIYERVRISLTDIKSQDLEAMGARLAILRSNLSTANEALGFMKQIKDAYHGAIPDKLRSSFNETFSVLNAT